MSKNKNIVVDTSIFVSALISSQGASREVLRRCLKGIYQPLMGTALYHEHEALMDYERVVKNCPLSKPEREAFLNAYMAVCQWVHVYYLWRPNLQDEGDNHIVELAVAGNARTIVTHNIRDFKKPELLFPSINIVEPSKFLEGT